jgi:hypothetical protein
LMAPAQNGRLAEKNAKRLPILHSHARPRPRFLFLTDK